MDGSLGLALPDRRALVTGASRGIGKAIALALARAGADMVLLGRSESDLAEVAVTIRGFGREAEILICDLLHPPDLSELIGRLGRIDILVNNSGMNIPEPFVTVTESHYDQIFGLNMRALFFLTQSVVDAMIASQVKGAIVNITSQMGHVGAANRTVYCAVKHAVEGFTKALAIEVAPHGIRVNSVAPTFVETEFTKRMFADESFRKSVLSKIPIGRLGRPEDIAPAVVFLCSDVAALITGSCVKVDGGWTAQ
ncbi:MAG TPA: SDR family oxidoreductase [Chthoniobacterales bacterium]|jgi:NAD(P)-dependent dehydrogenase (short-subunit alcohol dehydrogenase family)